MFEVTIKGETLEQFHSNLQHLAAQFGGVPTAMPQAEKPKAASRRKPEPDPQPELVTAEEEEADWTAEDDVQPMPETAKAIVDAGTGKPAPAAKAEADTIKMTFDDVKAAAAKLAAKDTPQLAAILKKYKAAKISEVPGPKLGEFASDVMEALG